MSVNILLRTRWFEEYRCGCVSEYACLKKDLCGYCPIHGETRRNCFRLLADKRNENCSPLSRCIAAYDAKHGDTKL